MQDHNVLYLQHENNVPVWDLMKLVNIMRYKLGQVQNCKQETQIQAGNLKTCLNLFPDSIWFNLVCRW